MYCVSSLVLLRVPARVPEESEDGGVVGEDPAVGVWALDAQRDAVLNGIHHQSSSVDVDCFLDQILAFPKPLKFYKIVPTYGSKFLKTTKI